MPIEGLSIVKNELVEIPPSVEASTLQEGVRQVVDNPELGQITLDTGDSGGWRSYMKSAVDGAQYAARFAKTCATYPVSRHALGAGTFVLGKAANLAGEATGNEALEILGQSAMINGAIIAASSKNLTFLPFMIADIGLTFSKKQPWGLTAGLVAGSGLALYKDGLVEAARKFIADNSGPAAA
jgi:hypothetical protein